MQYWWADTDRANPKYLKKKKLVPMPLCPRTVVVIVCILLLPEGQTGRSLRNFQKEMLLL